MSNTTQFLLDILDFSYTPDSLVLENIELDEFGGTTLIYNLDRPDYEQLKFDLPVLLQALNIIKPAGLDLGLGLIESFDLSKDKRVYGFVLKGF